MGLIFSTDASNYFWDVVELIEKKTTANVS